MFIAAACTYLSADRQAIASARLLGIYSRVNAERKRYIDRIHYSKYKEKGYFVGSGAIESANKVILQRRLKQAGMRWSVSGAQYLLSLRAKVESRRWDSDVKPLLLVS